MKGLGVIHKSTFVEEGWWSLKSEQNRTGGGGF